MTQDPNKIAPDVPWMALILLADGECSFDSGKPIAECVTPGVVLEGRNDVDRGDRIVVTAGVVAKVFPTKAELPLLAHVREVDLHDTELALGDDDGWMAVVISNRLPQPGVRYRACLVSLEGQYDVLPDTAAFDETFTGIYVYPDVIGQLDRIAYQTGYPDATYQASTPSWVAAAGGGLAHAAPLVDAPIDTVAVDGRDALDVAPRGMKAARAKTEVDAWSSSHVDARATIDATKAEASYTAHLVGAMHNVDMGIIAPFEAQYRFPVLAHWEFTCTDGGDFQSLMEGLDVGMIGTLPPLPAPAAPGAKPPPLPTRAPPEVLDTGHIALDHVTREGESATVWYRGPLVPRPTSRAQPASDGRLPLAHTSDQLRRVGPDGRENLGAATAFEIGRLMALAEPSVVASLLTWRKDGFDESHRAALTEQHMGLSPLGVGDVARGFGARAGHAAIAGLGADGAARLGRTRPVIDQGRSIEGIDDADPVALLATGLGTDVAVVKDLVAPSVERSAGPVVVPRGDQVERLEDVIARAPDLLVNLRIGAQRAAGDIARTAVKGVVGGPGGHVVAFDAPVALTTDALDDLLGGLS